MDGFSQELDRNPGGRTLTRTGPESGGPHTSNHRTWTSPTGRGHLDWGNIRRDYWAPACAKVFAGTDKATLAAMPPKTLRKAAITWWADSGISPALAADWAGHSEEVAARYYAGRAASDYSREVALLSQRRDR